ncbi:cytochrome C oxidase subunit I [Methylacidiphilum kamchatkense Kam1]|uniref:Cytochrome C oxidase subunit I n=1 Tax=Methylacidiphilum kamchatkense Kam1 TaxID=1202785 RepID=A0A0C1RSX6_9BACT|nr:cbb3-type cytochrome c oxidase subunit I [Methylacidiphilum kamchatkense]KIE58071.1 cytochrome C oxidase subunit I [Methylacidiphilum kamchatkense Kam1]QDQ41617.1 cytochrome c oxidase subunit 1 [Methylacidiphilum kamchatkense Kam1]
MDSEMSMTSQAAHGHHEGHEEISWIRKYVFSTDHKMIGYQYMVTSLFVALFAFFLMVLMRWQLSFPGKPIPIFGPILEKLLGSSMAPGGVMTPQLYNSFGAMHGTMMIFMALVPALFAGFGNFVVPLQIGAPDMAFPRLNMASFWLFFVGVLIMMVSFFVPGGAAKSGWTSYTPLADFADMGPGFHPIFNGQTLWLIGMAFNITGSLLGSVNIITTIIQLRTKGLSWMRLPVFVWSELVTAFLLLLAFPPLESAAIMQLMDRLFGTSFFSPEGLIINGKHADISGGGSSILWQHLFWFLGHPEVYVQILPTMGIVGEIFANNTRKPLWSYKVFVYSLLAIGFLSMIVWAHHMYMTGMGQAVTSFFQIFTTIISIPSVLLGTVLLLSLWGASIRFNVPMLFALAWLPMFGIGGLTGLPLGWTASDVVLHDTYYVIGHFHYMMAPASLLALFAGIYYWFPKATGRYMNEFLGKIHFWPTFIFFNGIFFPMLVQGFAGVHRRWYDGGAGWQMAQNVLWLNQVMSFSAWALAIAQIPFIINFFWSLFAGKKVTDDNPWQATTLEWATPTPPGHGNFLHPVAVYRDPYEYSVPGYKQDYLPQWEPDERLSKEGKLSQVPF